VRRLGEEALLAIDRERRADQADDVHAAASDGGSPALQGLVAARSFEPDSVRRTATDDQEVATLRHRASAIAERLAALERVDIEHGCSHLEGGPVPEPQVGAHARADDEVGIGRAEPGQLADREVADEDGACRQAGGDHVVEEALHLAHVRGSVEGKVHRDAYQAGEAPVVEDPSRLDQLSSRHAVPAHRGQLLEHEARIRLALRQVPDVGDPAHGVDDPVRQGLGDVQSRPQGAPGGEDLYVACEPIGDVSELEVGADRQHVDGAPRLVGLVVQPGAAASQSADAEAVAVALGDRDDAG